MVSSHSLSRGERTTHPHPQGSPGCPEHQHPGLHQLCCGGAGKGPPLADPLLREARVLLATGWQAAAGARGDRLGFLGDGVARTQRAGLRKETRPRVGSRPRCARQCGCWCRPGCGRGAPSRRSLSWRDPQAPTDSHLERHRRTWGRCRRREGVSEQGRGGVRGTGIQAGGPPPGPQHAARRVAVSISVSPGAATAFTPPSPSLSPPCGPSRPTHGELTVPPRRPHRLPALTLFPGPPPPAPPLRPAPPAAAPSCGEPPSPLRQAHPRARRTHCGEPPPRPPPAPLRPRRPRCASAPSSLRQDGRVCRPRRAGSGCGSTRAVLHAVPRPQPAETRGRARGARAPRGGRDGRAQGCSAFVSPLPATQPPPARRSSPAGGGSPSGPGAHPSHQAEASTCSWRPSVSGFGVWCVKEARRRQRDSLVIMSFG